MPKKTNYKNYIIEIEQDGDEGNPYLEMDQVTDLVTWHRNYDFNSTRRMTVDRHSGKPKWESYAPYDSPQEVLAALTKGELVYAAPLYAYEHGGITVNLGSMDYRWPDQEWDCGLLGFVYITKEKARAEWPNYGGRVLQHVCHKMAKAEVEVFDCWLTGDVWGFWIYKKDEDKYSGESCWGFYGYDDCLSEAKATVDNLIANETKKLQELRTDWFGWSIPLLPTAE